MQELFRLKIASKRQMTAPQRLLDALQLGEGDEIQIEVADGHIVDVHPAKAVPTALLTEALLSKLKEREERLIQGEGLTVAEILRKAEASRPGKARSATGDVVQPRANRRKETA
jgi:antitoxin component of MazEF toxin-antitoxin module